MSLEVTMFGGFVLRHNGKQLKLERNNVTRSMQVLQMLLFYGEHGVPKNALIDQLFGYEVGVTNPANNLKVTISNLRRILKEAGLENTTVTFKAGSYYLVSSEDIFVDVLEFQHQAELALEKQDQEKLAAACELYAGDLLPHLENCDWVVVASVHYKELYAACVAELCEMLSQQEQWQQIFLVATKASALCPQENWDILRIRSLLSMQCYREAKEVYEETANRMLDDFGVKPSERMTECIRQLDNVLPSSKATLDQLQDLLREDNEDKGAYYCPFPSFIDTYRTVNRMLERSGQSAYLMLCWITDKQGRRLEQRAQVAQIMPQVGAAIRASLRRGDIYTRAEGDRFLILLTGINQENCNIVIRRIDESYTNLRRGSRNTAVSLHYQMAPIGDLSRQNWQSGSVDWD